MSPIDYLAAMTRTAMTDSRRVMVSLPVFLVPPRLIVCLNSTGALGAAVSATIRQLAPRPLVGTWRLGIGLPFAPPAELGRGVLAKLFSRGVEVRQDLWYRLACRTTRRSDQGPAFVAVHEAGRLQQAGFVLGRNRQKTVLVGMHELAGLDPAAKSVLHRRWIARMAKPGLG